MKSNILKNFDATQRLLLCCLVIMPLIAWLGPFDVYAERYVTGSLENAGVIYATARGINGIVSVLQTTEAQAFVVSAQFGQILDPLNDLIERFSALMLMALGSLALQRIIIEFVSESTFQWIMSITAMGALITLIMGEKRIYPYILKAFWIVVFLRFSMVVVLIANSWVDDAFITDNRNGLQKDMEAFSAEIREKTDALASSEQQEKEMEALLESQVDLDKQLAQNKLDHEVLQIDLENAKTFLSLSKKDSPGCRLWLSEKNCSVDVLTARDNIKELKHVIGQNADSISALEDQIEAKQDTMECLTKRANGKSCSIVEAVKKKFSVNSSIPNIDEKMKDFVDSTVSLLMTLLFQTLLIPLAFLYCLVRVFGGTWSAVYARSTDLHRRKDREVPEPNNEALTEKPS